MVDGEHHAAHLARGEAEVDRRLAAVGPDLDDRAVGESLAGQGVQGQPFRVGHEAPGGAREGEQVGGIGGIGGIGGVGHRERDATRPIRRGGVGSWWNKVCPHRRAR